MIVVDDGSADPAALRAARRARPRPAPRPARGPAAARNAGLAAATTPLVAFLDSDVLPEPGWLAPLLGHLADPAVGLVAPRIVALPARSRAGSPATRPSGRRWTWARTPPRSCPAPGSPTSRAPRCSSAAPRSGPGFDERMHVAEDVDLVLRLHARGLAAALRAGVPRRARAPHRPARLVAAQGVLRQRRGPARPAPPRGGAAAGAHAVVDRRRRAAAGPPPAGRARRRRGRGGTARPAAPGRAAPPTAARIVALGAVGAVAQTADGITRHFWPLTALACATSRRARRVVAAVAVVEGLVDWHRHRRWDARVRPGPLGHVVAHRLDDLAYGTGLWWGAAAPPHARPRSVRSGPGSRRRRAHRGRRRKGSTMTGPDDRAARDPDAAACRTGPAGRRRTRPRLPDPSTSCRAPRPSPAESAGA